MGDHTEAIGIDFDPKVITYDELLAYFWNGHRCDRSNSSVQYMNAIFYNNDEQKTAAEKSLAAEAKRRGISTDAITTKVLPTKEFTYAEAYHQKYALGRYREFRDFLAETYPTAKQLADSTVATRLCAYFGSGEKKDWKQFLKELPEYGLPEKLEKQARQHAEQRVK